MIEHVVVLDLKSGYDQNELNSVMEGLAALSLDGFLGFEHGPNRDFEGRSSQFSYGFIGCFSDAAALQTYANDPTHQSLGGRLVSLCNEGADGIFVVDLEV